jgi:CrcB protein
VHQASYHGGVNLRNLFYVAAGGALGSLLRFAVQQVLSAPLWPWGTLVVNISGAFGIGFLLTFYGETLRSSAWQPFLIIGLLGGFTTFSALAWETYSLSLQAPWRGAYYLASALVGGGIALAAAVWLGACLRR